MAVSEFCMCRDLTRSFLNILFFRSNHDRDFPTRSLQKLFVIQQYLISLIKMRIREKTLLRKQFSISKPFVRVTHSNP